MSVTRPIIFTMLIAPAILLAGCGEVDSTPKALTEKQAKVLDKQLAGKVAEAPVDCINNDHATNLVRVSDDILLYRTSGRLVYKNQLKGSCPGLARDSDIVVTETFGSKYCKGDLVRLVDRTSGIPGPTCLLGEFTPYRKPKG